MIFLQIYYIIYVIRKWSKSDAVFYFIDGDKMKEKTKRQKAIIRRRIFIAVLAVVLAATIALLSVVICAGVKSSDKKGSENNSQLESSNGSITSTEDEINKDITATVLNTGDILIHENVLNGARQDDGSYSFAEFYKVAKPYITAADYAVVNLEVTLGGEEAGKYRGYPSFNTPDSLLDYVKADGFDMLLTANNHSLDTGLAGLKRTVQQIKASGLDFLGTKETTADPTYVIKDINGIKIGMVCYTYGTNSAANGAGEFINYFSSANLPAFYTEAQAVIDDMKQNGAEAIVFYMHWGDEYHTTPNTYQKAAAQSLCNMGVDVIVGAHPHVLQPIELIHSEDSQNTTVCLYSMGNSISNQRIVEMTGVCETGHTEDGVLFSYTFTKDADGEVSLTAVDIIPTWVDRWGISGNYQYTMYPLESADMANSYGLDDATANEAAASYERTKQIIAAGLTECQQYLGCEIRFAEQVSD